MLAADDPGMSVGDINIYLFKPNSYLQYLPLLVPSEYQALVNASTRIGFTVQDNLTPAILGQPVLMWVWCAVLSRCHSSALFDLEMLNLL